MSSHLTPCASCRFWLAIEGHPERAGQCRAYAPRPQVYLLGDPDEPEQLMHTSWPLTRDGCGEHEPIWSAIDFDTTDPVQAALIPLARVAGGRVRRVAACFDLETVGDLTEITAEEILGLPRCGHGTLEQVRHLLEHYGLKLRGDL